MNVSIVMAFHNRRNQLLKTLDSIRYFGDPEIIIVDDASDERVEDLPGITVIRIEPPKKTWINPCIPFNVGFAKATGDIIIIQNPECIHIGDILSHTANIKEGTVFSHAAYSLDYHLEYDYYNPEGLKDLIMNEPQRIQVAHHGWYNHSIHRPVGFHFCMAIKRTDLEKIGGFDERFAGGIGFDDNDLVRRIRKAGMDLQIIDDPFVIHQKHARTDYQNTWTMRMMNEGLYLNTQNGPVKPPQNKYYA
jgi:GT2 family glycosyltransferase